MKTITHIKIMMFSKIWLSLLICAAVFSCSKDSTEPVDSYDYYPLQVGWYAVYDVRQEIYSSAQKEPVIKISQEKDEIEDVQINADGISTYTFSRSTRANSTEYWQKVKQYTVQKFPDKLLTNIDNQTFFSMVFPVDSRIRWNGNTYNNLDPQEYRYENLAKPVTVGEQRFNKSLTVVERKDSSIINRYVGIKQYGLGVGLILDDQTNLELCQSEDCIGSEKVESGSRKTRKIVEFGTR
jgi:hypothetical protein